VAKFRNRQNAGLILVAGLAIGCSHVPLAVSAAGVETQPAPQVQETASRVLKICLADAQTGNVEVVLAERDADGLLRSLGPMPREIRLERSVEAAHADWFREREPLVWKGKTYRPGEDWQATAVNRYLRHQGLYRGVPLLSLWPGGDRTLAVLVDQESCTFRRYEPIE
jgi:hypothetical protein